MKGANVEKSTEENPVISYEKEGIYTISLKASNKHGEDEAVKTNIITVSPTRPMMSNATNNIVDALTGPRSGFGGVNPPSS